MPQASPQSPFPTSSTNFIFTNGVLASEPPVEDKASTFKIAAYNAKPSLDLLGKEPWGEFLGVELEVETAGFDLKDNIFKHENEEHAKIRNRNGFFINQLLNKDNAQFVIIKSDGSLKMGGVEICSSPASITEHKERWSNFFLNLPKTLTVHDTCGMHVHISREPLSYMQIGKMISFIHNPDNRAFIKDIAGRDANTYSDYTVKKSEKHAMPQHCGTFNHYSAVNLTNPNTIEIRIFAATLDSVKFFANLEFCLALAKYSFPSRESLQMSKDYKTFVKFISAHYKDYPNLYTFLVSKGYIAE